MRAASRRPVHDCPGGCGAPVRNALFACTTCWRRLPADLKSAILATYGRDHMAHLLAMADARRWYRAAS